MTTIGTFSAIVIPNLTTKKNSSRCARAKHEQKERFYTQIRWILRSQQFIELQHADLPYERFAHKNERFCTSLKPASVLRKTSIDPLEHLCFQGL